MADGDEPNPFEAWDLDPLAGPGAITERMRERMAHAPDEETRRAIRAAWEELTMHPARRLRAALGAHPDSHGLAGAPPPAPPRFRPPALTLELTDLALRPSVLDALGEARAAAPDVPAADDPILGD